MIFDFNFMYFADNKFEDYLLNNSKTTIMAAVGFASLDTPKGASPVKPAPLLFLVKNHLRLNSAVCSANPRPPLSILCPHSLQFVWHKIGGRET